ncbi:hypothetical protein KTE19_00730 [Lentilactobacillus sp. IMAU92037]|uniref:hypothetical protein n=1 Tax=Lentilactobacillus TaxID=2767893 RepID=UPI001C2C7961|nr:MULTISPECIES: hypothetical protein [Lentilactobacillus]MBV0929254.1 hypothetical protein [Lentilactobacillus dabitei]MDM7517161.1 hypothetical protein [Lentilactobacillus sp. TOM.63]
MKRANWFSNLYVKYGILWIIWLVVQDYGYGELVKLPSTASYADFIVNTVIKLIIWGGLVIWWLVIERKRLWLRWQAFV